MDSVRVEPDCQIFTPLNLWVDPGDQETIDDGGTADVSDDIIVQYLNVDDDPPYRDQVSGRTFSESQRRNNASLVFKLIYKDISFLITGDINGRNKEHREPVSDREIDSEELELWTRHQFSTEFDLKSTALSQRMSWTGLSPHGIGSKKVTIHPMKVLATLRLFSIRFLKKSRKRCSVQMLCTYGGVSRRTSGRPGKIPLILQNNNGRTAVTRTFRPPGKISPGRLVACGRNSGSGSTRCPRTEARCAFCQGVIVRLWKTGAVC
jgi:hypothetical protein